MRPIAIIKMENSRTAIEKKSEHHVRHICNFVTMVFVGQILQIFMVKIAIETLVKATAACRYLSATRSFVRATFEFVTH